MTWRKRQQDAQDDRERQAHDDKVGTVFGLTDQIAADNLGFVGWMRRNADSVKGQDHICSGCSPESPGPGFVLVLRYMLAATMKCSRCGTPLEGNGP